MATVEKKDQKEGTAKKVIVKKRTSKAKTTQSKAKDKKLDDINKAKTLQKVTSNREIKYKYPENCKDPLARKAFRQKVRAKLRKFERDLAGLKGKARTPILNEFKAYKAEVLL